MNIGRAWVKLAEFAQTRWRRQERCLKELCSPRVVQVTLSREMSKPRPSVATHTSSHNLILMTRQPTAVGQPRLRRDRLHHPLIKYGVSVYSTVFQRVH